MAEGGAEQMGAGGKVGKREGAFGLGPGGEVVKHSGWSLLGKTKMLGAGQCGQQLHSLVGRGVVEG